MNKVLFSTQVGELVEVSGGQMDDQMANKFEDITRTILSNQTEALANLTKKVEKEIEAMMTCYISVSLQP